MDDVLADLTTRFWAEDDGFPKPDWWACSEALKGLPLEEEINHEIWEHLLQRFDKQLVERLGEGYTAVQHVSGSRRYKGPSIFLVSSEPDSVNRACFEFCISAYAWCRSNVFASLGDDVDYMYVVLISDPQLFAEYSATFFHADGEYGSSSGYFSHCGIPLIVVQFTDLAASLPVLAHEISHLLFASYDLPSWLDEGLAQIIENGLITGNPCPGIDFHTKARDLALWSPQVIQRFWRGGMYTEPGYAQSMAYRLSWCMTWTLLNDHGSQVGPFLQDAHLDPVGELAARRHLGIGVGELAAEYLGPGRWGPVIMREVVKPVLVPTQWGSW